MLLLKQNKKLFCCIRGVLRGEQKSTCMFNQPTSPEVSTWGPLGGGLPHLQWSEAGRKAETGKEGCKVWPSLGPRYRVSSTLFLLNLLS